MGNPALVVVTSATVLIILAAAVGSGALTQIAQGFQTANDSAPGDEEFEDPWSGGGDGDGGDDGGSGGPGADPTPDPTEGDDVTIENRQAKDEDPDDDEFSVKFDLNGETDGYKGFILFNEDVDCSGEITSDNLELTEKSSSCSESGCDSTTIQYGTPDNTAVVLAASEKGSVLNSENELSLNEGEPASIACIQKP